jgi:hypothetical protein
LRAAYRYKRTSATLAALLYIFFSLFGAMAHTHAPINLNQSAAAAVGSHAFHTEIAARGLTSSQPDCAACEWQALSVTQTSGPQPHIESALLCMVSTVPSYAFFTVCLTRFSSRAPPAA